MVILSRRTLCYALAFLWLLDGAFQLQSFMFTTGFAHQVLAPSASGQPGFVAGPVNWNARLVSTHPAIFNAFFAGTQILLGVLFSVRRTVRIAIAGSVIWAIGVWYLGEGLGGLAGGHMTALLGAPGAAILYAVLALAAWPRKVDGRSNQAAGPPEWTIGVWVALWVGLAVLNLLPGNVSSSSTRAALLSNISGSPGWVAAIDRTLASFVHGTGITATLLMVGAEVAIGFAVLGKRATPTIGLIFGIVLSLFYWAVGQGFGQPFSGQATDPSTGPLLVVLALVVMGALRDKASLASEAPTELGLEELLAEEVEGSTPDAFKIRVSTSG